MVHILSSVWHKYTLNFHDMFGADNCRMHTTKCWESNENKEINSSIAKTDIYLVWICVIGNKQIGLALFCTIKIIKMTVLSIVDCVYFLIEIPLNERWYDFDLSCIIVLCLHRICWMGLFASFNIARQNNYFFLERTILDTRRWKE